MSMTTPTLVAAKEPDTQKGSIARPQLLSGAVIDLIDAEPTWWEFPDGRRRALHVEKGKRG